MRHLIPLSLLALAGATACKTTNASQVASGNGAGASAATPLTITNTPMRRLTSDEVDRLVEAFKEVEDAFYNSVSGYKETPGGTQTPPPRQEIPSCMSASPNRWSDLAVHYYSRYPGYSAGYYPNVRECFTYLVLPHTSPKIDGKKPTYPEAFDYCTYMPVDRVGQTESGAFTNWGGSTGDMPKLDENNRTNNRLVGPFGWVQAHQPDVFKFVMFQGPCAIHPESQQEVINKVYGVDLKGKTTYTAADKDQVDECNQKRYRWQYDPQDGTHCSYDMRATTPLAVSCK